MRAFFWDVILILRDFILGQFIVALIHGLTAGLGFWALGLPHAPWFGLWAGVCSLIPVVGTVLGYLPAVIMAWVAQHSFWPVLGVLGIWGVVQALELFLWQPKILGGRLNIHPLLVIPILFFGGLFFGVLGVLLALPAVAIAQAAYKRLSAS